ncbi:MAG: hypothetical protein K8T89_01115 [Planctomycetes bacterium]|nr:hypothetical protein [Planctomycetota bacterium]
MKRSTALLAMLFLAASARAETSQEVFERRILPIFKSPSPSSCVQCHLAAVDLKNYILPSHRDTFLSLRDQGLIDLDNIEKSKILGLIERGKSDKSKGAVVHQENRVKEFDAFVSWLKASAADPALRNAPKLKPEELAKPPRPVEVIRHARKDRLLESFENNVWSMRFRCMNCHNEGTPQNQKLVAEFGERVAWFRKAGPEATLDYLRSSKLIDLKNPEKSLLLLKPLNIEKHKGGVKFEVGDQGYKAYRTFLEDYARIMADEYKTAAGLPAMSSFATFGTDRWIKLTKTPDAWGDKFLTVRIFAWDEKANAWEKDPIASTDRRVFGKGKLWQHNLTLMAAKDSDRAKRWKTGNAALPKGKYLVKVYIDQTGKLVGDWKKELTGDDFAGQIEITSDWKEGYGAMTSIDATGICK